MKCFIETNQRNITVGKHNWRYYRLGNGPALLWLTGGLRRAAYGFGFMNNLSSQFTITVPDYPTIKHYEEMEAGLLKILEIEKIQRFSLIGQSYGGFLAQAFLASNSARIERMILSSSGPAVFSIAWLPIEYIIIGFLRILPERKVKAMLESGLDKIVSTANSEKEEWQGLIRKTMENDLSREDVVSHFAVAADIIRYRIVTAKAYQEWKGHIFVLRSDNDPTQGDKDLARYQSLYGKPVQLISMGSMGHTALMFDPSAYADFLRKALKAKLAQRIGAP